MPRSGRGKCRASAMTPGESPITIQPQPTPNEHPHKIHPHNARSAALLRCTIHRRDLPGVAGHLRLHGHEQDRQGLRQKHHASHRPEERCLHPLRCELRRLYGKPGHCGTPRRLLPEGDQSGQRESLAQQLGLSGDLLILEHPDAHDWPGIRKHPRHHRVLEKLLYRGRDRTGPCVAERHQRIRLRRHQRRHRRLHDRLKGRLGIGLPGNPRGGRQPGRRHGFRNGRQLLGPRIRRKRKFSRHSLGGHLHHKRHRRLLLHGHRFRRQPEHHADGRIHRL